MVDALFAYLPYNFRLCLVIDNECLSKDTIFIVCFSTGHCVGMVASGYVLWTAFLKFFKYCPDVFQAGASVVIRGCPGLLIRGNTMKKSLILSVGFTCLLLMGGLSQAYAESKELPPSVMEEVLMSEQLIAIGKARKEPLLILAAMRLRSTLGQGAGTLGDELTTKDAAITEARKLAKGNAALLGIVDDVATQGSRRMCIYARNGACY
jgi:hypothetical protein